MRLFILVACTGVFLSAPAFAIESSDVQIVTAPGYPTFTLGVSGEAAKTIYEQLSATPIQQDAEGYSFEKSAPGISCLLNKLANIYNCDVIVDKTKGILL